MSSLRGLSRFVSEQSTKGFDYTTSLAWKFITAELEQTRVMGYVPEHLANKLTLEYRQMICRALGVIDPIKIEFIEQLIYKQLRDDNIPYKVLRKEPDEMPSEIRDGVEKSLQNIQLDLKPTASYHHLVKEGGKMEDGRIVLNEIIRHEWIVPVLNLETFEVEKTLPILRRDDVENISTYLFFTALQAGINFCLQRGLSKTGTYKRLPGILEQRTQELLHATIVHINEPGKLRELIKSSAFLSWILTPASKISQTILGIVPEHTAGLERGNQDWYHIKRISGDSSESSFMYDERGQINKGGQFSFQDWTQATDCLSRRVGIAKLRSYFTYIGFPIAYGELILLLIREPQPVKSVVYIRPAYDSDAEDIFERIKIPFNGTINEGFMMGNQVTKTILHLVHVTQLSLTKLFLEKKGINISPNFREQNPSKFEIPKALSEITTQTV
jgi:hypothetical protein